MSKKVSKKAKKTVKKVDKKDKKSVKVAENKKPISKKVEKDEEIISATDLIANLGKENVDKNTQKKIDKVFNNRNIKEIIHEQEISEMIENKMPVYGASLIIARALCDIDGFKPIQRKILWAMSQLGGMEKNLKSSMVTGDIQGKYSPHADCYESIVLLTREREGLLTPLVKGKGSFGKQYSRDTQPGAPRYTEVRLEPICHEMLDNVKKVKDNFKDNYSKTLKEPKLLMCKFPLLLANENNGVAYSLASEIGSFNLRELCDATIEVIKNYKKDDKELYKSVVKVMPTFDFTTGCEILLDKNEMKNIYLTGDGKIGCRATFTDNAKERVLEIRHIPYTTTLEEIIDAIMKAYSGKRFEEVSRVVDGTDADGLKIVVEYKRGTDVEKLKQKLLIYTPCQDNFNSNIEYTYNNQVRHLGIIGTLKDWIEARRVWLKKELTTDLEDNKHKLNLLEGLQKILLDIDKAIKIVRQSKTDEEVIEGLKKVFKLDDEQAEFVANIKLRNLNKDYILNKTKEIKDLKEEIKKLEKVIKDGIDEQIITDLEDVKKKYGYDRKSKIITEFEALPDTKAIPKAPKEEVNMDGNSVVLCGTDAVKRVSEGSSASMQGYKKYTVANSGEILAFTNKCKVFKWNVAKLKSNNITKIADIKKIAKKLEAGEHIIYTMPLIENNKMVVVFENKKAVKFSANAYKTEKSYLCFKKGLNIKNGTPIYIESISEDKDITINGKTINTADIKEVEKMNGSGAKIKI